MEEYQTSCLSAQRSYGRGGKKSDARWGFLPIENGMVVPRGVSVFAPFQIASTRATVRARSFS